MIHKRSVYRHPLMLSAMLVGCIAFLGCPETTEMVDDIIQPPSVEIETTADPQEPETPPGDAEPGDDLSEPTTPPPGDAEPGDDLSEPATPPPGAEEPGGDLSEPTAPTDAEDPTEAPSVDDSGAGGVRRLVQRKTNTPLCPPASGGWG